MVKEKYTKEYYMRSSPHVLYNYISAPSALAEWFADNVVNKDGNFTFTWDGAEEYAQLVSKTKEVSIRFQWEDDADTDYYWEMAIKIDSLTKDVALLVTDFAEPDEIEESKQLWDRQIDALKHVIGS
ncbi:SRPBCC domain-containing protein [bacterium SCSIO 12643]|nr:SRPBCC domain-containing protein [bacterium SCSIO 12643]